MPFGKRTDISTEVRSKKDSDVVQFTGFGKPDPEEDWDYDPPEKTGDEPEDTAVEKVSDATGKMDLIIDRMMNRGVKEGPDIVKNRMARMAEDTRTRIETIDTQSDKYSDQLLDFNILDKFTNAVTAYPMLIVVGVTLFVVFMLLVGIIGMPPNPEMYEDGFDLQKSKFKESIRGDFEVYLPQGDETQKILSDVQQNWSTDMIILYVQSVNAFDKTSNVSVKDLSVLREIDAIERTLDFDVGDEGVNDGIVWMFSLPMMLKLLNATPERVANALESEFGLNDLPVESEYELPQDQDEIDALFRQMDESAGDMGSLWIDTNDDNVVDTTMVLLGVAAEADKEDILEKIYLPLRMANDKPNPPGLIDDYFVLPEADADSYFTEGRWWGRVHQGQVHCRITPTGPTPLTKSLTDRTYQELFKVFPAALFLVATALLFFHRTWKILIIAGTPVVFSLIVTFGILGVSGLVLTPQVTMMAPILVALGVAYGLYVANRYVEEYQIEDRKERIKTAVRTTGKAIFLSAVTTSIGFGSLMGMNMIPLQVLGFGLASGIMISWAMTMVLCPALIMLLNYKKPAAEKSQGGGEESYAEKMGRFPVNHRKKIIATAIIITIASGLAATTIQSNMDYMEMSPQDEPVVVAMREVSEKFGGGQIGMVLVEGYPAVNDMEVQSSMKDYSSLQKVKRLQDGINQVDNSMAIGLIDILVMMEIPDFRNSTYWQIIISQIPDIGVGDQEMLDTLAESIIGSSFYSALGTMDEAGAVNVLFKATYDKDLSTAFLNVFYESIGPAVRAMMVSSDFARTLVYVNMPTMDVASTEKAVNEINAVTGQQYGDLTVSKLTGFGAIVVVVNDLLMVNAVMSTVLALGLVFVVLSITFMLTGNTGVGDSVKTSFTTLIPVFGVVAWQFLILFVLGIIGPMIDPAHPPFSGELNLFTAMIGSIMVGIGIDFCIHITERVREGGRTRAAVQESVATSGMSFVESTTTMIMGLAAVFLMNIPAIREFITLVMLLLIFSAAGAILLLPAIYTIIFDLRDKRKLKAAQRVVDTIAVDE